MTERDPTPITGTWRGHTRFQCRLCAFDTLEEGKFVDHFAQMHPPLEVLDGGLVEEPPALNDRMGRDYLEDRARMAGIEEPETYPNKAELIAAIEAAQEGGE